jgi:hypothetical protein
MRANWRADYAGYPAGDVDRPFAATAAASIRDLRTHQKRTMFQRVRGSAYFEGDVRWMV